MTTNKPLTMAQRDAIYDRVIKKHGKCASEDLTASINLMVVTSGSREEFIKRRDSFLSNVR